MESAAPRLAIAAGPANSGPDLAVGIEKDSEVGQLDSAESVGEGEHVPPQPLALDDEQASEAAAAPHAYGGARECSGDPPPTSQTSVPDDKVVQRAAMAAAVQLSALAETQSQETSLADPQVAEVCEAAQAGPALLPEAAGIEDGDASPAVSPHQAPAPEAPPQFRGGASLPGDSEAAAAATPADLADHQEDPVPEPLEPGPEAAPLESAAASREPDPDPILDPPEIAPLGKARRYQPRLDRKPSAAPRRREQPNRPAQNVQLGAELALFFRSGGWSIELGVLFHRGAGMGDEIGVRLDSGEAVLWAVDDHLYEVHLLADPAAVLDEGIAAQSLDGATRWVRTARDLHVFAPRSDMGGFFTSPRVRAGVENAIICSEALEPAVLSALAEAGVAAPVPVAAAGVPSGWRCYRDLRPSRAGADSLFPGVLAALNPLAEAEIDFVGGVHLGRFAWLDSHPPAIAVIGTESGPVLIDGQPAEQAAGAWRAPGWDSPGAHRVEHGGKSKSYQLQSAPVAWPAWAAHQLGSSTVCGALVHSSGRASVPPPLDVACWLIGARPGEVAFSDPTARTYAPPTFESIWAIPVPSGRRPRLPVLIGPASAPAPLQTRPSSAERKWCSAIREAARRRHHFPHPETAELWRSYLGAARSGWRRR